MSITKVILNDVNYIALQYTGSNKQQIIDFLLSNYYSITSSITDNIDFVDTYGDTIRIVLNDWVVIADGDNTEVYVLLDNAYRKMFNIA